MENEDGRTFLDICIERYYKESALAAMTHDRWRELLEKPSSIHGTYMIGLVKHLPSVVQVSGYRKTVNSMPVNRLAIG